MIKNEKIFPVNKNKEFSFLAGDWYFTKQSDSTFTTLQQENPELILIRSNKNQIIAFNKLLDSVTTYSPSNFYYCSYNNNYKIISKENQTYILDANNSVLAEIKASRNAKLFDHFLVEINESIVRIINLKELFP